MINSRLALNILLMLAVALTVGFGLTYLAIGPAERISAIRAGPWHAWPHLGTEKSGPYAVARHVQSGQLPLGANEGIAFFASYDSNGRPLDSSCNYSVAGLTPVAKLWTLSAYDVDGRLNVKWSWKTSLNSRAINRRADGSFNIVVSDTAHFGNWLPVNKTGPLTLVLRLYDTPIATGSSIGSSGMPSIIMGECA